MTWTETEITRRLFVAHAPEHGAAALVFGSAGVDRARRRVERAVALWRQGWVPRLLLTGGGNGTRAEAEVMAEHARALGVDGAALLLEPRSCNTQENARLSADLLAARGLLARPTTLLLVSAPWHLGRVLRAVRMTVPTHVRLRAIPSEEPERAESWQADAAARRVVEAEAGIFEAFAAAGLLGPED